MVNHIEHRSLAVPLDLAADDRHHISDYSLSWQVSIDLVSLNQNSTPSWLRSAWHALWQLLDLYPLVIHHPRHVDDEIETSWVVL